MKRVSFQGEIGAYGEQAARSLFGPEIEPVPCRTFGDTEAAVGAKKADCAMLPAENSIAGSVGECSDILYESDLRVVGEVYQKIEHCLIGLAKGASKVRTVYSHMQALDQCREYLSRGRMQAVPAYDTAGSVRMVKEMNDESAACIASKAAARIYGMPVIEEGISGAGGNYTRFLALAAEPARPAGPAKTSVIFAAKHEPGALYEVIRRFAEAQINLTRIESYPRRRAKWEYNFYADFEGDAGQEPAASALRDAAKSCLTLKVLGSYEAAQAP